jgi:two-component system cell cycle sensor histidine kinase/response regulator CckA
MMVEAQPDEHSRELSWSPLLELLPGGVALLSPDGELLRANPPAKKSFQEHPALLPLAVSGGGLLHSAGIRVLIQPAGSASLVILEPAPLSPTAPLSLVMERSGLILRSEGLLRGLAVVGSSLLDVLDEADQEDLNAVLDAGGGSIELLLRTARGPRILSCRVILDPALGGWVLTAADRTLERRLQNALREGERRFLRLIEGIPVALIITDSSGLSAYANVRADVLLGGVQLHQGTPLKALLKTARMRSAGDGQPYPLERLPMLRALNGERCSVDDVEMFHDGRWISLEISSAPVSSLEGESLYVITILQDISARQELQHRLQRVQRMEAVGQLAGELAHDFNNFLTAISSYSQLTLSALSPDHAARGDVEEVIQTAHRAAGLTRQLLTISRRQPMNARPLSLVSLLQRMDHLLRRLLGEGVTLEVDEGRGIWPVMADTGLLERVIINLVLNARDAMVGVQGARLRISLENVVLDREAAAELVDVKPGAYVVAAFEDNGSGISASVIDHIFEPFFSTKSDSEGTGLGLSMVYGVIRQSGGFLSVDSHLGKGANFRIALPRSEWGEESLEGDEEPGTEVGHILLVEDEEGVRRTTARMLRSRGYTVEAFATPFDALQQIMSGATYDLVLSDVHLPGMRGDAMVAEILNVYPDISVLFISGSLLEERLLERMILTKPFTAEELVRRVSTLLSGKP